MIDKPKPWSVSDFMRYRPGIVGFVETKIAPHIGSIQRTLIRAPVKSGKREIVEYLAMRDYCSNQDTTHLFISSWHRKADNDQRVELKKQELQVFSIITKKKRDECISAIDRILESGSKLVIHIDECDHGSQENQLMNRVWTFIRNLENVTCILYSATPEEVMFSGEITEAGEPTVNQELIEEFTNEDTGIVIEYNPSEEFCGPGKFLDENLIFNAHPFFEKAETRYVLSDQAKEIISNMLAQMAHTKRNVCVLRLSYSEKKTRGANMYDYKAIYQFLRNLTCFPELQDFCILVDKAEKINMPMDPRIRCETIGWSDPMYWRLKSSDIPIIVVVDQTSSRSTEWACHDRVFAQHDYRHEYTYTSSSQAFERTNHYLPKYGSFQPIRMYCHKPTIMLSAGRISYQEYLNVEYVKQKVQNQPLYQIKRAASRSIHETHSGQYSEHEADKILIDLGCKGMPTISQRVCGSVKERVIVDGNFIPCNSETFSAIVGPIISRISPRYASENTFIRAAGKIDPDSGLQQGYLREWRVLQYKDIEKTSSGLCVRDLDKAIKPIRTRVCYNNGVLGVGYTFPIGKETLNTLTSIKSQYIPKTET